MINISVGQTPTSLRGKKNFFRRAPHGFRWLLLICVAVLSFACSAQKTGQAAQGNWDLDDQSKTVLNVLALSNAMSRGDMVNAKIAARELARLAPTSSVFLENAAIFLAVQDTQEAAGFIREGLQKYPDDLPLTLLQAELYVQGNNRDAAVKLLTDYLHKYPDGPKEKKGADSGQEAGIKDVRIWLSRMHLAGKNPAEALKVLSAIPDKDRGVSVLFLESRILYAQKKAKEAKQVLQNLIKKEPQLQEAWLALAAFAEETKDYNEAADAYKKALGMDPENNEARMRLIAVYIKADKPDEALNAARDEAVSPETKIDAAALLMDSQRFTQAATLLKEIKEQPGAPDEVNFYLAALAFEKDLNLPEAVRLLDEIPPGSPSRAKALRMKSLLFMENHNAAQAIEAAKQASVEFPDELENIIFLAQLYARDRAYAQAETLIRDAMKKWPDNAELLFALGSVLDSDGQKSQAMRVMEEIILVNPRHAGALNYIGYSLAEEKKDLPRALELITRALEVEPNSVHIVDSLSWAHYQSGNYQEAWTAIQRCIDLGANDPTVWEHYGDIALAVGKKSEAVKAYTEALALNPDNAQGLRLKIESIK